MNMMDSKSGPFPTDSSLINPDFIRRLHEQRVLHKREVAFYIAEAEKHGAADEALATMIQAAEKVVAILFPDGVTAADAPDRAAIETMSSGPNWTEAAITAAPKAAEPLAYSEPPMTHGPADLRSEDRTGGSGNTWRARLLSSRP